MMKKCWLIPLLLLLTLLFVSTASANEIRVVVDDYQITFTNFKCSAWHTDDQITAELIGSAKLVYDEEIPYELGVEYSVKLHCAACDKTRTYKDCVATTTNDHTSMVFYNGMTTDYLNPGFAAPSCLVCIRGPVSQVASDWFEQSGECARTCTAGDFTWTETKPHTLDVHTHCDDGRSCLDCGALSVQGCQDVMLNDASVCLLCGEYGELFLPVAEAAVQGDLPAAGDLLVRQGEDVLTIAFASGGSVVQPEGPVTVTIHLPGMNVSRITHADGTEQPFTYADGVLTLTIDRTAAFRLHTD